MLNTDAAAPVLNIVINRQSGIPLYLQIADAIEMMIYEEKLRDGTRMPSERVLADALKVHRNTIIKAYDVLISRDCLFSSRKKPMGYFVKKSEENDFTKKLFPLKKPTLYRYVNSELLFNELYFDDAGEECIYMAGIVMDRSIGPRPEMEKVVDRIFGNVGDKWLDQYQDETHSLKRNICRVLSGRNTYVKPNNIQITAETNQTISYLLNLYTRPGDVVIVEEPIIPDLRSLFQNKGIRLVPVTMENDGMNLEELEEAILTHKPKFIYTIPTFHNPTGITLSIEKRHRLIEIALKYNVPIIEDDYQSAFHYDRDCIPSLYQLDKKGAVILLDSFTMTFPFGAKIGFMLGPEDLVKQLGTLIEIDETLLGNMGQYFLNEYIECGDYDRHLLTLREILDHRMNLLTEELERIRDKGIRFIKPQGGVVLWCTLKDGIDYKKFHKKCSERGLKIMPGWVFFENPENGMNSFRLSISKVKDEEVIRAVKIIGEVLDELNS